MKMLLCGWLIVLAAVVIAEDFQLIERIEINNPLNATDGTVFYQDFGSVVQLFSSKKTVKNLITKTVGYDMDKNLNMNNYVHPPLYFNLYNEGKNLGQYVLLNRTLHKISDGRDATVDTGINKGYIDNNVYIATEEGIYTYDEQTEKLEKYGNLTDNIIAIDKVSGRDEILILTSDHKMYRVTQGGTVKTLEKSIQYAKNFVVNLLENIYYTDENDKPHVLVKNEELPREFTEFNFEITNAFFGRPVWVNLYGSKDLDYRSYGIPYIVDGVMYVLTHNTSLAVADVKRVPGVTAFSGELGLLQYYAVNGNILEHNLLVGVDNDYDLKKRSRNKNNVTVRARTIFNINIDDVEILVRQGI